MSSFDRPMSSQLMIRCISRPHITTYNTEYNCSDRQEKMRTYTTSCKEEKTSPNPWPISRRWSAADSSCGLARAIPRTVLLRTRLQARLHQEFPREMPWLNRVEGWMIGGARYIAPTVMMSLRMRHVIEHRYGGWRKRVWLMGHSADVDSDSPLRAVLTGESVHWPKFSWRYLKLIWKDPPRRKLGDPCASRLKDWLLCSRRQAEEFETVEKCENSPTL